MLTNLVNSEATMGSLEISELVESRHDSVKRTIERLADKGVIRLPPLVGVRNHLNQAVTEYKVGKRDSYVVVAQLCPEFTARLVDRWQELEGARPLLPQSLPEALRLAADLAEDKQRLEDKLAIAAPKVDFADRVGESAGVLIGNYAKTVGIGPNKLFAWMRDNGVLIALGSRRNIPMQEYMDRGYFTIKETPYDTNHGVEISFTTKITGKGQQWLTTKLLSAGILKAVGNAA